MSNEFETHDRMRYKPDGTGIAFVDLVRLRRKPDEPRGDVLRLRRSQAIKLEREVLAHEPFPDESWESAVKKHLILRSVLGCGPATAKEICDALMDAKFDNAKGRNAKSCLATVYRVLRGGKYTTPQEGRRWLRYQPRQFSYDFTTQMK